MSPSWLALRELAVFATDSLDKFTWFDGAKRGRKLGMRGLGEPFAVFTLMILWG